MHDICKPLSSVSGTGGLHILCRMSFQTSLGHEEDHWSHQTEQIPSECQGYESEMG